MGGRTFTDWMNFLESPCVFFFSLGVSTYEYLPLVSIRLVFQTVEDRVRKKHEIPGSSYYRMKLRNQRTLTWINL